MAEVYLIAEDVDVEELPHILFSLVSVEPLLVGKLVSDFGDLHLDSPGLGVFVLALADVGDELVEAAHRS